jgi:hypothetical protein
VRYLSERGFTHKCPHCKKVSVLAGGPSWLLGARFGGFFVGGVPLAVLSLKGDFKTIFGAFVVGGLLTALPIDKFLDGHYRRLVRLGYAEKS